jgi:hypothetical protein
MAWIESHQALAHHPKTIRLAAALKCGVPAAIGYVHLLWYWALDYAPEGSIDADMRDQVALACHWRGKTETFWLGMLQAGFIESSDAGIRIHDWMDYAGRLIDRRDANRARSKRARDAKRTHTEREANAATNRTNQPVDGVKPSTLTNQPPNPLTDADAQGDSVPRVGSPEPAAIHPDAKICGICRRPYTGEYIDHTAEKHRVNSQAEPGNLHFSRRFRSSSEAPPPEFEAQLAAGHERIQHLEP